MCVCVCVCVCFGGGRIFKSLSHYLKSLWNSILLIKLLQLVRPFLTALPSLGLHRLCLLPEICWIYVLTLLPTHTKNAVTVYSFFSWLTFLFTYSFNCLFIYIMTIRHVLGKRKFKLVTRIHQSPSCPKT